MGVFRTEYVAPGVPEPVGESVLAGLSDSLEDAVPPGLPVAAEGDFCALELGETVPLREPVLVDEGLPDTELFCVAERETTGVLLRVAAPEVVFDTEAEAV